MILLSGTSNKPLAQKVAHILNKKLGDVEITRFIDNECRVYVKEDVKDKQVYVLQSLSQVADQHLVELCLIGQAIKGLHAKKTTAIIPWMGYSKQDKAFRRGEAISAQLVARFLESAGFDEVITVELHSENVTPYFQIPVTELSTHDLLGKHIKKHEDLIVVSPDQGGQSRSDRFAEHVKLPIVYLEKKRNLETGDVSVHGASSEVKGKDVIIFDDIINTGSTAIKAAQFLKKNGAKKIHFLATHPVFAGEAVQKLSKSVIDEITVCDTIPIGEERKFKKLKIVSVSDLISEKLDK